MNYETIIYEKKDNIGVITFNRPERKNALSVKLLREIPQAAAEAENDDEVVVVVLTGNPKAFCAGADVAEIQPGGLPPGEGTGFGVRDAAASIAKITKPTIAAISGPCVAGGLALAMACDIRIASETARIGDGHMKVMVLGDTVGIPRMIGDSHAKELIFTGDLVDGKEACRIGLVDHVYPEDMYLDEAMTLAKRIAENSPVALRINKKAISWGLGMTHGDAMRWAEACNAELLSTGAFKERVSTFFEKKWKK